jgi:hypothetical protein
MRLIDEQYLKTPWYSARQTARHLKRQVYPVGRKQVSLLIMALAQVQMRLSARVRIAA